MLDFFRKNQRYFFFLTAIVIILSFSFFGTFQAFSHSENSSPVVFETINGRKVTSREFDGYSRFLLTDVSDRKLTGPAGGANFLNDGTIVKQFLASGLAEQLYKVFLSEMLPDLQPRIERQKKYQPYVHPHLSFIKAEAVWNYFAPQLMTQLNAMRALDQELDLEAFKVQCALFLEEKKFPANYLFDVLKYQASQYPNVPQDPRMQQLNLFGYYTVQDWFGPKFLQLAVQLILNSADLAKEQGFVVTDEEAKADLILMAQKTAQEELLQKNGQLDVVKLGQAYFKKQLRILGIDTTQAVKIWKDVLLFRRLFEGAGQVVFQENLSFKKFSDFANHQAELEVYHLPAERRISDWKDLQLWETYAHAVYQNPNDPLGWPNVMKSQEDIQNIAPELIQQKSTLVYKECSKKQLSLLISLKQVWDWQMEETNWQLLKSQFSELSEADSKEERWVLLDSQPSEIRKKIDEFSQNEIILQQPEWLEEVLVKAKPHEINIGLRPGVELPFVGVKDVNDVIDKLITTPVTTQDGEPTIDLLTGDHEHFYRVWLIQRDEMPTLVSFQEAKEDGSLENLLNRILEENYLEIRAKSPNLFMTKTGTFKPFSEVKDEIAQKSFEPLLSAIQEEINLHGIVFDITDRDNLAQYRFYKALTQLSKKDLASVDGELQTSQETIARTGRSLISVQEAMKLHEGEISQVYNYGKGDLYFYQLKGFTPGKENSFKLTEEAYNLAGQQLKKEVSQQLINTILAKKGFNLQTIENIY